MNLASATWIDLGQGVRVQVVPVTPGALAAARAESVTRLAAMPDADTMPRDVRDGQLIAFRIHALAISSIVGWEGIAAPCDPEHITLLMCRPELAQEFWAKARQMAEAA